MMDSVGKRGKMDGKCGKRWKKCRKNVVNQNGRGPNRRHTRKANTVYSYMQGIHNDGNVTKWMQNVGKRDKMKDKMGVTRTDQDQPEDTQETKTGTIPICSGCGMRTEQFFCYLQKSEQQNFLLSTK